MSCTLKRLGKGHYAVVNSHIRVYWISTPSWSGSRKAHMAQYWHVVDLSRYQPRMDWHPQPLHVVVGDFSTLAQVKAACNKYLTKLITNEVA